MSIATLWLAALQSGSKAPFGQLEQIAEAQRAEASFAISAGETAVFELQWLLAQRSFDGMALSGNRT
jgi:hypothetical protein